MEVVNLADFAREKTSENREKLEYYVSLLKAANDIARLTGPSDETVLWNGHILDCASAIPLIQEGGRVIDVGTGGGLPGIVWAICRPDIQVTLLDSIKRKCVLVERMAASLGLKNVLVVCARSEDYAKERLEKFHIAAARAVCSSGILAEYLSPFIKLGGKAIAFKGPRVTEEIEAAGNKWSALGLSSPELVPYVLGDMTRYFLIWNKISQTPKGMPRRPGMAEKFPWYSR